MNQGDHRIMERAQELLDAKTRGKEHLQLRAERVVREADVIRVLVTHASDAHLEDFVYILAAVEADLDIEDQEIVLLVPVADEAA